MSSPITPLLFVDENGRYRLHLTGYAVEPFIAPENDPDTRFYQGKPFPNAMKKLGQEGKITEEEAIAGLEAATKYYKGKTK